jgi:hypothetical protein
MTAVTLNQCRGTHEHTPILHTMVRRIMDGAEFSGTYCTLMDPDYLTEIIKELIVGPLLMLSYLSHYTSNLYSFPPVYLDKAAISDGGQSFGSTFL